MTDSKLHLSLFLLLCAPVGLSACGGDDSTTAADKGGDRFEEAALKHARCMREQGIDVPDPKPGRGGVILREGPGGGTPEAAERAERKCRRFLEDVEPPQLSERQKTEMRDAALKHARCMRRQGIDFPDPKFDANGGVTVKIGEGFDPTNPRVRDAERKCARYGPQPRIGGGPGDSR